MTSKYKYNVNLQLLYSLYPKIKLITKNNKNINKYSEQQQFHEIRVN